MRAVTIPTRGVARKRLRGQSCQETTHKCSDAVKGDLRRSLTRPQSGTKRLRCRRQTWESSQQEWEEPQCCRSENRSPLSRSGKNHRAIGAGIGVNLVGMVRTAVLSERA